MQVVEMCDGAAILAVVAASTTRKARDRTLFGHIAGDCLDER